MEQSCLRCTADNSVVHVSILFQILSPFRLLQSVEQSYLCYTVGPCWLFILNIVMCTHGFPGGSEDKASACSAGDPGSIPGLGRSPGEGNATPLQYSCLENPMDRGAWQATVHGVAKSRTRLSDFTLTHNVYTTTSNPSLSFPITLPHW